MATIIERILSATLALSAVAIAGSLVHREFVQPTRPQPRPSETSAYVSSWRDLVAVGRATGKSSARITLIEFSDLECPFCRRFNTAIQAIAAKYPDDVNHVFIHLPLSMHRFAMPAARAAECAADVGHFDPMINVIFRKQDSLGLKSWASYAMEAGVMDTLRFALCAQEGGPVRGVETGRKAAQLIGVSGTPTVILNGWKYGAPPDQDELDRAIKSLLGGRAPYPAYPSTALSK